MLRQIEPRLGRGNVMLDSFSSCVANTPEKFSRAPKVPFSEILPKPRMLLHDFESRVSLKKLQCPADRHCGGKFNKKMDVVSSNMQLINLASISECSLPNKSLAIRFNSMELERVPSIFRLPHKVEGILPEGMAKGLKVHFFAPPSIARSKAHAKSVNLNFTWDVHSHPIYFNQFQELNLWRMAIPHSA
jgi:hypothetical protein